MLRGAERLKKSDFKDKKKLFSFASGLISISVYKSKCLGRARFAVVVPHNITKNKPAKNKLRRRIYSLLKKREGLPPDLNIVFFPSKKALQSSFSDLKKETENLLKKLDLLKPAN